MTTPLPFDDRVSAESERLRASGALGRSDSLIRLFDFLAARTLEGRAPKEIEIAQDVFDKSGAFDGMFDASVRVCVHRLRRKIDDFYAGQRDRAGDRLYIPKGEYRLAIEDAAPATDEKDAKWRRLFWPARPIWRVAIIVALIVAVNAAIWFAAIHTRPADPLATVAASRFWGALSGNGRPSMVVTGDYYLFGEAPTGMDVARLVREFEINSKEDLDQYLMAHPESVGRYVDMGLYYLPSSTAQALRNVLPIVDRAAGERPAQELITPTSQLTQDMLKKANIVYLGYLSALGPLRDPVFSASGFQVGSSYDELTDRATGRRFVSDQGDTTGPARPRRDFAYLASLPGPAGGRVLIIAGTRDAGVLQAVDIASDPVQLERIAKAAGGAPGFEALYEVRTLDATNYGSRLVLARGLHSDWLRSLDRSGTRAFPDQIVPSR